MAGSKPPALDFRGVGKAFGDTVVLDDFTLTVAPGETVTLIGPSGSGKTTVLRLAMLLERPDRGDIRVLGESITNVSAKESRRIARNLGMVFQQFNLFPHMTILQNLDLAQRTVMRLGRSAASARSIEHLEMVGLRDKADCYPLQLSGGQQQRVALARALTLRPKVLLLDEITSALDPELVGEVLEVVRKVTAETDITTLLVTHEMRFARDISDRVVMMDEGRVIEEAPPRTLFTKPSSPRTQAFIRRVLDH
ncbi:amino acid ABC transporter ATP-binding protein [Nonomuraea rhizosphaerae]|uniref:amino acid ABC transporter ATP-binding protein n=1 Tax=Nonomuraea rhizosphaerae TaxID=2665663 RepID=UPI001C5DCF67|nr:amino acid ABC transporter ATP-binding protein [Nonomuraea rhizosphaerae]